MPKKIKYNPADRMADLAMMRMQGRIKQVYAEAEQDITKKLNAFIARFREKDAEYQAGVKAGKIAQADYDAWRRGQIFQGKRWRAMRQEMTEQIYRANKTAAGIINGERRVVFQQNANYLAYQIEKGTRGAVSFGLYDSATVTRLLKEDRKLLPEYKINQRKDYKWNNQKVNSAVTQSIVQGESIDALAKRMTTSLEAGNRSHMLNFARTAMTGAQNAGRIEAMHDAEDMGITVKKRWIATLDSRTRDAHAELDGQIVDVDEPFEVGGMTIMYPGDPNADPSLVYNCRCTLGYEYPEYSRRGQRRDNETKEVIEYQTYREWEKAKTAEAKEAIEPEPEQFGPTIAGVMRGEPMSHSNADSGHVNPNYGRDRSYGINCQSCVVTYEARRRGYDVEVVPNDSKHPMCHALARDSRIAYKNKDGTQAGFVIGEQNWTHKSIWKGETPTAKRFEKLLDKTIEENGRYTLEFKWRGYNAAHIVTLTRDSGELVIYDPQSDRTFRGLEVSSYLERLQYKRQFYGTTYYQWPPVMRVDDKDFDFDVVNQVTQQRTQK